MNIRAWWRGQRRRSSTGRSLTWLEKIALVEASASASYKLLLWQLGMSAEAADPRLRGAFAVASFLAPELIISAVVFSERRHGRTVEGSLTIVAAAAVSAIVAYYGAAGLREPWVSVLPALLLIPFALYLGRSRGVRRPPAVRTLRRTRPERPRVTVLPPRELPETAETLERRETAPAGAVPAAQPPAPSAPLDLGDAPTLPDGSPRYPCPHCGTALRTSGDRANASRHGSCKACKVPAPVV